MADQIFSPRPSQQTAENFIDSFSSIYEHTLWIVTSIAHSDQRLSGDFDSLDGLHSRMCSAVLTASHEAQLNLIRAHPDLGTRARAQLSELTADSRSEQTSVGLDSCTPEEFARFQDLNERYKLKFEFPFIMAVRGANRFLILEAFERRIQNEPEVEFQTALHEINKIARFRLLMKFEAQ